MDPLQKARLMGLAKIITAILGGYGIAVSDTLVMELISLAITLAPLVADWFKHAAVDRKIKEASGLL
jgi:hypothetical protein